MRNYSVYTSLDVLTMARVAIPEGIVRFTHALVEDGSLRRWFLSLELLPESTRRAAFTQMADQMTVGREDPELAAAAASLVRPEMYDAVRKSVRERCGI